MSNTALTYVLCALPALAIGLQYAASKKEGTTSAFLRHYSAAYVDLIFIGVNFCLVRTIDWTQGMTLCWCMIIATIANSVAHLMWQQNPGPGGHMIDAEKKFLMGGWVHLIYSTIQMSLLLMFFFTRTGEQPYDSVATSLLFIFFIAAWISGFFISGCRLILTDMVMTFGGVILTLWPYLTRTPAK